MSDLAQFSNKTLSTTSPVSEFLSSELQKTGFDYAVESMGGFLKGFAVNKGSLAVNQISQSLDEYETTLGQSRLP